MRRAHLAVLPTIVVVATAVTGCTQESPRIPDATTQAPTKMASYPLRVFRACTGACPVDDQLTVQPDGGVLVQVKGRMVECQLDKSSLATLNNAAVAIKSTDLPTGMATRRADAVAVWWGSNDGLLDIDDERIVKAKPVIEQLLDDVHAPAAQRKICT